MIAVSAVVVTHLVGVAAAALAAPSGPWGMMEGRSLADPPPFADGVARMFQPYLTGLHLTNHYRFTSNHPGLPGVSLEARLRDEAGHPIATLHFPEETATCWVRDRERNLVRLLADDQPVEPPQGEVVAPPGGSVRKITIWDIGERPGSLNLLTVDVNLVPRNRPVFRPSERSLALARSYARYLGHRFGAASVELIRHTRSPVSPWDLVHDTLPQGFDDLAANFEGQAP